MSLIICIVINMMIDALKNHLLIFEKFVIGNKIDIRTVAYIIAIKRILSAEKLRGNL